MTALAYCKSYRLPAGYNVEFCLDGGRLDCIWTPEMPSGTRARKLLPNYQAARNDFLASLGIPTLVVDL